MMLRALPIVLLATLVAAAPAAAQRLARIDRALLAEVMPEATRFDQPSGDPPVISGYVADKSGAETLLGYVFVTSDLPPEQYGYSGPIEALVGMTVAGELTGVRVTDYRESYMRQMGDFLRDTRGFQEQFTGKYIGDPFRVWGDVDGISRVSISVRALSRGVRDASRRVAAAYAQDGAVALPDDEVIDIVGMSWFEMRRLGVVQRFEVTEPGEGSAGISLGYIGSDRVGEYYFGRILYERALRSMERRGGADHLLMYAVDGSRLRLFERKGWSIVQGGDTLRLDETDVVSLGLPSGGIVSGEATMVGVMLLKGELDIRQPFDIVYDIGEELGVHTVEYVTQDARIALAEQQAAATLPAPAEGSAGDRSGESVARDAAAAGSAASDPTGASGTAPGAGGVGITPAETTPASEAGAASETGGEAPAGPAVGVDPASEPVAGTGGSPTTEPASAGGTGTAATSGGAATSGSDVLQEFDFVTSENETLLERTLADVSWSRVAMMLLVLGLATWAFFAKVPSVRWVSLGVTLVVLGFVDGGFLSVSHITSGIWAGPGVYLRDVPLLLIATFTVVTTLIWGRVFCGFLCPFGALQDFIDRLVPRRFRRELPQGVHDRALWVKYGILGIIVLPALAGSHASFYQYFEPFGTVFFMSSSLLFWGIAGSFLVASAIVPRFYCRYACPLGAALGLTSLLSLRRIPRVEQCDHCKVCEQQCPTGAIRGPDVDFKECVRCNACEIQLIEKRGVCRHDMEQIRPRLVQLQTRGAVGVSEAG